MTLEVEAVDAYTLHNVPITVAGTVVIKIGSTLETIATAAEQYLGKEPEQMHHDIRARFGRPSAFHLRRTEG